MGFIVPAVHYSALATLPPELTSSKSQHSIPNTTHVRFKLNQIFKKLLNDDSHQKQPSPSGTEKQIPLPETTAKENDTSIVLKNPTNNNSGNQTSPRSTLSPIEPLERLPFTEPYFPITPKSEPIPFELSAYHKNCIRQEKCIGSRQYHSDLTNYRLQKPIDQADAIKGNNKVSNSATTLPELSSIEDRIGLKYATQRNTLTSKHGVRASYFQQQQTQHLRRLQNRSKLQPIPTEVKPSISSSIAHRIELLKKAMHKHQLEVHPFKSLPTDVFSSTIDAIHKQTQTNSPAFQASEIHHIHHHHIYSSSIFSIPWRTHLSILGTCALIFFLLIQFISISF